MRNIKRRIDNFTDAELDAIHSLSSDPDADSHKAITHHMRKSASPLSFILNGIIENRITGSEAARSAAIGALSAALAGAGIGAISGKKGKRRRRAMWGALIGAISGGLAGPAVAQYLKYMAGVPFDNSKFSDSQLKRGDKVYLGVAGSANGENNSWFADEMRERFPGRAYMLRHVDGKRLKEKYDELTSKGMDVTVVGHSSGGRTAAEFLRNNPSAKGYLIDPVSWTSRGTPNNAMVFTADKGTRHGGVFENYVADIGGRWNEEGANSVSFRGSHSNRIKAILRDFVSKGVRPGDKLDEIPEYISAISGKKVE